MKGEAGESFKAFFGLGGNSKSLCRCERSDGTCCPSGLPRVEVSKTFIRLLFQSCGGFGLCIQKLLAELGLKHGIRVDESDPAMGIVASNRLVLKKSTDQISDQICTEIREFEEAVAKVLRRAGQLVAQESNYHLAAVRKWLQDDATLAERK